MDIQKALAYVFDDERWVTKILIGAVVALFSFLIIPAFFLVGYMIEIVRNVMAGVEKPLPEWKEWGKLFMDGLNLTIAGLIYTLPIWILMCISFLFFIPAGMTEGDVSGALAAAGGIAVLIMSCLGILFAIALALLGPAITIQYAREDTLGAALRFREVIDITRDHLGDVILALVVTLGLSFVLGLVGIIPIIGWLIALAANAYTTFVTGHMYGQIAAKVGGVSKEKLYDDPSLS